MDRRVPGDGLRSDEAITAGLTLVFVASLAVTYAVDRPALWLAWAVAMAAASGAALVVLNR